jgi:hypothetical protein
VAYGHCELGSLDTANLVYPVHRVQNLEILWGEHMKQVKLFVGVDDYEVGLVFTWNEAEHAWVCKMDDDFMQELGPLSVDEEKQ